MKDKKGNVLHYNDLEHKKYMEWLMRKLNRNVVPDEYYFIGCYVGILNNINSNTLKQLTHEYRTTNNESSS